MPIKHILLRAPIYSLLGGVCIVALSSLWYRPLECVTLPDNTRVTAYSHGWPLETMTRTTYHDWNADYARWTPAGKDLVPNRKGVLIVYWVGVVISLQIYMLIVLLPHIPGLSFARKRRAMHTTGHRRCPVWRALLDGECREIAKSRDELWRRIECGPWYNPAERNRWVITQRNETLPVVLGRAHTWRGRGGHKGIHVHWACPFCGGEHVTDRIGPPPAVWPCEGRLEIALVQWKDIVPADDPLEVC